jgi:hypothetical protein
MPEHRSKNHRWKLIASVILVLFVLISAAAVYLNYYWRPILNQRIKIAIYNSTDKLYRVDFDNIRVNFLSGKVTISNIHFKPDTAVYELMKREGTAPGHIYKVEVAELILRRIQPWKVYFDNKLEINSVEISRPVLQVTFSDIKKREATKQYKRRTAYQHLVPYLKSVKIGSVVFRDADFKYMDNSLEGNRTTSLKDLYIKVSDILIDSASQFDHSRLYYTRDIYAELLGYNTITLDSNYVVKLNEFRASTAGGYARIRGLSIKPRFREMEFSRRFKYQKDRYSIDFEEVQLNKVNYELLNSDRRLVASALLLKKGNFAIFLNRQKPDSIRNKGKNFPQLALQRFKLNTSIDTILLQDSRVDYSEFNPNSLKKGTVTFSKVNGTISNVTNDSLALSNNKFCNVKLTSLLMDRGRMDVNMKFNLSDPRGAFSFKGALGKIDADVLNPAIRPLSLIEIKSGFIEMMLFDGSGSISGIRGNMTCYYNNLKIMLLERSEESSWFKRKGLASIFANTLIIKDDNPLNGQPVRTVDFQFLRPQHSSFFNMIWKGFAQALLETIGFDSETQNVIKARLRRMEAERIQKDDRRDDRLKKRDLRRGNREANR